MNIPKLSVDYPVTITMFAIGCSLIGLAAMYSLNIDLFPNIDFPLAFIQAPYPGVDPSEMENIVTRNIEEEINTVENVKKISSTSFEGFSWISVEFKWGTDVDLAAIDLREKVDVAKRSLPRDMEQITVAKLDINSRPIMELAIGGDMDLKALRTLADREIKPAFERIPGVASVEVTGGFEREIRVKVDPVKLRSLKLSINDIIGAVSRDNLNSPVGNITEGNFQYLIRAEGEVRTPQELEKIIVKRQDGRNIYLGEIARVEDSYKELTSVSRLNGKPSVNLSIKKESGANPVLISNEVQKLAPLLEKRYSGRIKITIGQDSSTFIRNSINMVKENATVGALLAMIVLFLFLKNFRTLMVVSLAIPFSILVTFGMLYLKKNMTLNLMTLGGLALGIGMILDNAVVVIENIYRYMSKTENADRREISAMATNEVWLPILASTLTSIAVFLPIGLVPGIAGEIFFNLSLAIMYSLTNSLVVAITVIPMVASKILRVKKDPPEPLMNLMRNIYRIFLTFILATPVRRYSYAGAIGILFVISLFLFPPMEFFPPMDRGEFIVSFKTPEGTSIEKTDEITREIEKILSGFEEVDKIISTTKVGEGSLSIVCKPKEKRKATTKQIIEKARQACSRLAGYQSIFFSEPKLGPPTSSKPIQIQVFGDDFKIIEKICFDIEALIRDVPGLKDIDNGVKKGRPEVSIRFDRERIKDAGVDLAVIASIVRSFVYGTIAGKYKEKNEKYDIRVEADENYKNELDKLAKLEFVLDKDNVVTLSQVASLEASRGYSKIERQNLKRLLKVEADISGRPLQAVVSDIQKRLERLKIPEGYMVSFGGEEEERREAFGNMFLALWAAIGLVYAFMASQFESFSQPFVIMFTIPLSIIGVVAALRLYGFAFSITALVGIIMLAGLVVNNGIILIDFINRRREQGLDKKSAAIESGVIRLRPILITVSTTCIGMLPLSLGWGAGADFFQPLAITVIGGFGMSTILTLTFIPVLYIIIDDWVEWAGKLAAKYI